MSKETWKIDYDFRERAFLLQFEGDEDEVVQKTFDLKYYNDPVNDMKQTGLFGILDALIDLGLTNNEIMDFYVHGHVEPYDDPYEFTYGIINIVYGMSKDEIKNRYRSYFNDERIAKLSNSNNNTKMLMSFCYDKDDMYVFIPNKDDLYDRFSHNYSIKYHHWDDYKEEKNFLQIDGKLYRAVRFLVRQGYDFPELESLFNESIKDIVFKQTNGENTFVLNKDLAREMSDNLLSLVYLLKRNNYKFLNPAYVFDSKCDNITLINPNEKEIIFNRCYLESDVNKYLNVLVSLNMEYFEVPDIISLCDKRVKNIELKCLDNSDKKHDLTIKRDVLLSISEEWFRVIKKSFNLGFSFPDNDNLFNMNQEALKVIDPNGKEQFVVRKEFTNILEMIILCMKNGYNFKDYSHLFNGKQPYIVCYDEQNQEKLLSRKQIYKFVRLLRLSYANQKNLTDIEKDLLMMLENDNMRKKLFEWLPYTAKKWIPSSAVINKIPAEKSYEYFYNNNHKRLKVLKDAFQANKYEEMEGIISLGYILGLFDSKESTSEKAMNYIIDYFLKKGITTDELHTTYGAINLKKDYNKQFADFFMQHYAINRQAFIEPDLDTNMTGELFEKFDEVLKSRPEKKIKTRTRNKLLTPIDAMASITDVEIDKEKFGEKVNDGRYFYLIKLLAKFGASEDELKWAIELYEQALSIDEQKVNIPNIEDLKTSLIKFNSHLKSDPQAFLSGRKTNCCSKYGGYAEDRLTHVITDLNWRYVTFTSPNRTFFDGLVWYDKEEQVVCIDNVEGQFSSIDKTNPKSIAMMAHTVIRYADGIYHKMNELNIPCIKVNVGKDPGTESWKIFEYANHQNLIYEDENSCNYPKRNRISSDAGQQFTVTNEKILRLRGKH